MVEDQYKDPANLEARAYLNRTFGVKKNKLGWYKWLFKHISFPKKAKVLELGCGLGNIWTSNKEDIPEDAEIIVSDFSEQMLKKTRENLKEVKRDFNFELVDVEKLPYETETIDIVIANHLLYLVPNINKAIGEISRVLKKGGVLVASTNSSRYMKELEDLLRESKLPVHLEYTKCPFSLENSKDFLSEIFSKINTFESEGLLRVTEAEPLANYVLSTNTGLGKAQKEDVYNFFKDYFKKNNQLEIRKISGVVIAEK